MLHIGARTGGNSVSMDKWSKYKVKKDISIEKAERLCRRMILVCVSPDKFSGLSLALNKDGL